MCMRGCVWVCVPTCVSTGEALWQRQQGRVADPNGASLLLADPLILQIYIPRDKAPHITTHEWLQDCTPHTNMFHSHAINVHNILARPLPHPLDQCCSRAILSTPTGVWRSPAPSFTVAPCSLLRCAVGQSARNTTPSATHFSQQSFPLASLTPWVISLNGASERERKRGWKKRKA